MLSANERIELDILEAQYGEFSNAQLWTPASKPQAELLRTEAEVVLFGGGAAGGKSDCLIGYALLKGRKSLLLRKTFPQLAPIQTRIIEIMKGKDAYHAGEAKWTFPGPRTLELGSCPNPGDVSKWQGAEHSEVLVDEAAYFTEADIEFLMGWLRSPDPNQRTKMILASNPPLSGTGQWLTDWFRAWVDPNHPNPAKSGELRWHLKIDGKDTEVPKGTKHAISRTFIRSRLKDNPYLSRTDYKSRLINLPPELRDALLNGDFLSAGGDQPLQAIPATWIRAAQQRWKAGNTDPITHIGVDPARGGRDRCVIVVRRRMHIEEPIILTKAQCATGGAVAARILEVMGDYNPKVRIDAVGIGASIVDHLETYIGALLDPVQAAGKAIGAEGQFINRRAQMYWNVRERLDPATSRLELPPNTAVYSELSAPTYSVGPRGIQIQSKEDIIKALGKSPDVGDALVLAASAV